MVEIRHGLATLNSYSFTVYGQNHKVWVLVFLRLNKENLSRPKWSRLGEQQNRNVYSNSIQGTLLSMSSNVLSNKTVFSCLFVE